VDRWLIYTATAAFPKSIELAGVTAGTVSASKAVVTDANKDIGSFRDVTLRKVIMSTGGYLDAASTTATLSSNAATITEYAAQITSEALTTAAGAAQAFVITKTGVAATDLVFVTAAGGTNTREHYVYKAICTLNTVTVTVNNIGPTNALNGTLIFNLLIVKA
jgi:hypothetical protein